jgi:hypothetical protein
MKLLLPVLFITGLVAAGTVARADTTYTIPNGSFESYASGQSAGSGTPDTTRLTGFVEAGAGYYGLTNNTGYTSSTFDGSNHLFINVDGTGGSTTGILTTASPVTNFAVKTTYTLTVALGDSAQANNTAYGSPGNQFFSFLSNGVVVDTFNLPNFTLTNATSQDYSLTLDTASLMYAALAADDGALTIRVGASESTIGTPVQAEIDDIRLTSVADVPEPSTYGMVFGGIALLLLGTNFRKLGRL